MRNLKKSPFRMQAFFVIWLLTAAPALAQEDAYDGIIEPHVVINIGAPAEGIVDQVLVDRSSLVEKGQPLIYLDASVQRAAVAKASAMAGFNGEILLHKEKLAFVKRVHKRLKKAGAISIQEKDQAATEIVLTKYHLMRARENKAAAQLELKKAQALLARCTIKSPISGVVVERYVSKGEYVDNQPLLRIARVDSLRVEVVVPARVFGQIVPGMTAIVMPELPDYGEKTVTVTLVDKTIDSASNTFGVRLELPNPDNQLPSGLRCMVRFEMVDKQGVEDK